MSSLSDTPSSEQQPVQMTLDDYHFDSGRDPAPEPMFFPPQLPIHTPSN